MSSSLITLTTDFGLSDHYVAVMKGVIANINPNATLIDICHQIPAHGIAEAAFTIAQSYQYFPPDTTHLIVVDPGVGSNRKILLVEIPDHRFIVPDNGILSQIFERVTDYQVWSVDIHRFALDPMSETFHGRDILAPVAAHVATGKASSEFGQLFKNPKQLPPTKPKAISKGHWQGTVLSIDHFGNIVTSFPNRMISKEDQKFLLQIGEVEITSSIQKYYQGSKNKIFCIAGSSGYIEVSLRETSAERRCNVTIGESIELILFPH